MSRAPLVRVEGLRTLKRDLKRAGVSLQDLKDAHAEVANLVVRAAVPYAAPIHWGWPAHHIKAQPWVHDAAVAAQDEWTGVYLGALEHIIRQVEGAPGP